MRGMPQSVRAGVLGLLLILGPAIAMAAELAGTFVGGGTDFAVFLQIVPAGENRIVGRFRQVSVDNKGKPTVLDRTLAGGATSDTFVGKLEGTWDNGGDVAISGNWKGGALVVSNARGMRVVLQQGDEGQYNQRLNALAAMGTGIQKQAADKATADSHRQEVARTITQLKAGRERVGRFVQQTPAHAERAAATAGKYPKINAAAQAKLERLRGTTARTSIAEGDRGILAADIKNLAIDAKNLHIDVQNNQREFEDTAARLTKESHAAFSTCSNASADRAAEPALDSECAMVPSTITSLDATIASARGAYAKLESQWQQQKDEMQTLLQSSQAHLSQYAPAR